MARYMQKVGTPHIYPWTPKLAIKPGFVEIPDPFIEKEKPVGEVTVAEKKSEKAEAATVEDEGKVSLGVSAGEGIVETKKESGKATVQARAVSRGSRGK